MDPFHRDCLATLLCTRLKGTPAAPLLDNPEASAVLLLNVGLAGVVMEHPTTEWVRIVEEAVKEGAHESSQGSVDQYMPNARPSAEFQQELAAQLRGIAAEHHSNNQAFKETTGPAPSAARSISPELVAEPQAATATGPMSGFRASLSHPPAVSKVPRNTITSSPGPTLRSQQTLLAPYMQQGAIFANSPFTHPLQGLSTGYSRDGKALPPPTHAPQPATFLPPTSKETAPAQHYQSIPIPITFFHQSTQAPSVAQQFAQGAMPTFHQAPASYLQTASDDVVETPEDAQARRDTTSTVIVRAFKLCVRQHEPNMVPAWTPMIATSLKNPRHFYGDSPEASHIQLIASEMHATESDLIPTLLENHGGWPMPEKKVWFDMERKHFEHWTRKLVRPILAAAVDKWHRHMEVLCKEPRGSRKYLSMAQLDEELEKITAMDLKWLMNTTNKKQKNVLPKKQPFM